MEQAVLHSPAGSGHASPSGVASNLAMPNTAPLVNLFENITDDEHPSEAQHAAAAVGAGARGTRNRSRSPNERRTRSPSPASHQACIRDMALTLHHTGLTHIWDPTCHTMHQFMVTASFPNIQTGFLSVSMVNRYHRLSGLHEHTENLRRPQVQRIMSL